QAVLDLGPYVERMVDAPAPRRPAGLGYQERHHQGLEHTAAPARDDAHPPVGVMRLEDRDAQIRPGLPLRDLLLRTTVRQPRAAGPVIVLGRELAARDADEAGDPGLGIDHTIGVDERLVVGP